jgi:sugar phosphate isomerase/epimerase
MPEPSLVGRVAIVTGASGGIGRALAVQLAAAGGAVGATYAPGAERAAGVVALIEAAGGRAVAVPADLTDPTAGLAAIDAVEERFGPVDVLVANAGLAVRVRDIAEITKFPEMLAWQWKERVEPYWKDTAKFLKQRKVRVAIEMHPNFVAYNPETMLRLSDLAPGTIGCNFDPSHMFWQQVDPAAAIRALGDRIYHVHAKDCKIDRANTAVNGVLDVKKYTDEIHRSWIFRTVGYGNGESAWREIISSLRMVGYDHAISIEHEDSLMTGDEGLKKAIAFLKGLVISAPAGPAYWA